MAASLYSLVKTRRLLICEPPQCAFDCIKRSGVPLSTKRGEVQSESMSYFTVVQSTGQTTIRDKWPENRRYIAAPKI